MKIKTILYHEKQKTKITKIKEYMKYLKKEGKCIRIYILRGDKSERHYKKYWLSF